MHYVAVRSLSALVIAFAAGVNVGGADLGATVVGISTAAKFSALVLLVIASFALGAAAAYRLRRRRPDLPRPYGVIGYRVVPAIPIASAAGFVVNAMVNEPISTGITFGITFALILAGVPVYDFAFGGADRCR